MCTDYVCFFGIAFCMHFIYQTVVCRVLSLKGFSLAIVMKEGFLLSLQCSLGYMWMRCLDHFVKEKTKEKYVS